MLEFLQMLLKLAWDWSKWKTFEKMLIAHDKIPQDRGVEIVKFSTCPWTSKWP